ncbi:GNAT family N-acetyltransferase [Croceicoccus estronivorus]|uniref:GNAT family N-acetyltransferase n=1 Tax=Croceicoccus estronivorus TaxID=1172626 RepID=UPI0009ED57D5|nr:GNAT family N-acetyltransferase [Croceicoccus estronivorus]
MTHPFDDIRTARCRISPLQPHHAGALAAITDASVTARVHFLPEPFTLAEAETLIAGMNPDNRFLGVWDKDLARLHGVVGIHARGARAVEIGYWFAAAARGQGLADEAVRAVVAMLALRYPDRLILAECLPGNVRSRALLERLGFLADSGRAHRPGRALFRWHPHASGRIDVC